MPQLTALRALDVLYATTRDALLTETAGLDHAARTAALSRAEQDARTAFYANGVDPSSDMVRWVAAQAAQVIAGGRTDRRFTAGVLRRCDYATAIDWVS